MERERGREASEMTGRRDGNGDGIVCSARERSRGLDEPAPDKG